MGIKNNTPIITGHTNLYGILFDHAGIKNNTRIITGYTNLYGGLFNHTGIKIIPVTCYRHTLQKVCSFPSNTGIKINTRIYLRTYNIYRATCTTRVLKIIPATCCRHTLQKVCSSPSNTGIKKDTRNIIELIQRERIYSFKNTGIKNNEVIYIRLARYKESMRFTRIYFVVTSRSVATWHGCD